MTKSTTYFQLSNSKQTIEISSNFGGLLRIYELYSRRFFSYTTTWLHKVKMLPLFHSRHKTCQVFELFFVLFVTSRRGLFFTFLQCTPRYVEKRLLGVLRIYVQPS